MVLNSFPSIYLPFVHKQTIVCPPFHWILGSTVHWFFFSKDFLFTLFYKQEISYGWNLFFIISHSCTSENLNCLLWTVEEFLPVICNKKNFPLSEEEKIEINDIKRPVVVDFTWCIGTANNNNVTNDHFNMGILFSDELMASKMFAFHFQYSFT